MQAGAGVWGESVRVYRRPKWKILWARAPAPTDVLAPWPWWNIMPSHSPAGVNRRSIFMCREILLVFFFLYDFICESPVKRSSWKLHNYPAQKASEGAAAGWKHGNYSALLMVGGDFCAQIMQHLSQDLSLQWAWP